MAPSATHTLLHSHVNQAMLCTSKLLMSPIHDCQYFTKLPIYGIYY